MAQSRTDSVHVADYQINISEIDFVGKTISAKTDIAVVTKINNLEKIRLDLLSLTVDSVFVDGDSAIFSRQGDYLFVNLPENNISDTLNIEVYYHGMPVHDGNFGGFYFNGNFAYNVGVALQSQPHNYGRCWFPCVEEFTDKSSYSFNITLPDGLTAICNGMLQDTMHIAGSTIWSWRLDEPIPTYLASMAVGPYEHYSDTVHGMMGVVPIDIFANEDIYPNVSTSFVNLKRIFRMFEENFGAYRWPRIGYVCTAMIGGAMEHATNIAYPNMFVNGAVTYQDIYAHELFHHWFGNLITCEKPEEMWINEGFASFSEPLVNDLLYSTENYDAYIAHIRNTHTDVLTNIVKNDGGHYALDNVPQTYTYGTHSYQKGALVIHTLKSYMGNSLFFSSLKTLLAQNEYKNINSEDFFASLSEISGLNLTDFYNDWIHQPGFLDFEASELSAHGCGIFSLKIYQSGYGIEHVGNNVPIDITFVSEDLDFHTIENQIISGDSTELTVFVPFSPAFVILNRSDDLSDATIDIEKILTETGINTFTDVSCSANIQSLTDTTFLRVEHHYVAPNNPEQLPTGIHKISDSHYWNVRFAGGFITGNMKFKMLRGTSNQLDYSLFQGGYNLDNLKLLYRENPNSQWVIIPFTRTGSPMNATISTYDILPGQYCFAVGDVDASTNTISKNEFQIYPNPSHSSINIKTEYLYDRIDIFDSLGRKVKTLKQHSDNQEINIAELNYGVYYIVLSNKKNEVAKSYFIKK